MAKPAGEESLSPWKARSKHEETSGIIEAGGYILLQQVHGGAPLHR
jgi:hypothetical protein